MGGLVDAFQSKDMIKRVIVKGFSFAIRVDKVGKTVCRSKYYRDVFANIDGEKFPNVIHERYVVSVSSCPLWDECYGKFF